jgi:hypothetical protein
MPRKQTQPPDLDPTMDRVFDMLHGDDMYWHHRLKRVLSEAGFGIRRIEREECHGIWIIWLTKGSFELAPENKVAGRQIRKLLGKSGLKIKTDELTVLEQRRDNVKCVFIFSCGAAGVLT